MPNCRENDLAMFSGGINQTHGYHRKVMEKMQGLVVRVLYLRKAENPKVCSAPLVWEFEDHPVVVIDGVEIEVSGGEDSFLYPIRPDELRFELDEKVDFLEVV